MKKKSITAAFLVYLFLFSAPLLIPEEKMDLITSPACYKKGGELMLYIKLPIELTKAISDYQLKISVSGKGLAVNEVIAGDQLSVYSPDKDKIKEIQELQKSGFNNVVAFPVAVGKDVEGDLVADLELVASGKTITLLRSLITEESACPKTIQPGTEKKKTDSPVNGGVASPKDYRERFIYGQVTVKDVEWPDFVLILKAEKTVGGGVEKAYVKISQPGTYNYRLGNLYPGDYIFETLNFETDVKPTKVTFGPDELSKKIDIQISKITPVNLRLYNLEMSHMTVTGEGIFSYHLKAYVCRFDESGAKNLSFNWECGGIFYYNTAAPEKDRCVPLFPAPILLNTNEQITVELIVNPPVKKDPQEQASPELYESERDDNELRITLVGGS